MRWLSTAAMAGLAELAAYFLSLTWGFAVLIGGFCVVASLLRVTAAKVSTTETRLNGHIAATAPAINLVNNGGTIGGNLTVSGSHTVTGNLGVSGGTTLVGSSSCSNDFTTGGSHTVNSNLGVHGGTTMIGASSCSSDFTVSGSHTVDTNLGVHGGTTMVGASSCSSSFAIAGGPGMPNGSLGSASAPPSGGTVSYYAGNFYTGSGAYNWAAAISNKVDAIISALQVNNVTN